ncbi:MAG: hypothetical protein AAFY76_03305 [Cyanobacteria bacterium J06649_11]|nr:hypothetical protein [Rivularia sp. ALOHA_DT_140]
MMIFVLASGYLFAVYVFLAVAKKIINKTTVSAVPSHNVGDYSSDMSINSAE